MKPGEIILEERTDLKRSHWLRFSDPIEIVQALRIAEVLERLDQMEEMVNRGFHAAGFIAYEAAPAFDPAFRVRSPSPLPLLWFGIYRGFEKWEPPEDKNSGRYALQKWIPFIDREEYREAIASIKDYIAAGDTYQVNYTFRLGSEFAGDPFALWLKLIAAQPNGFAACVDTGRFALCSASPELFFRRDGDGLVSRPMKGTVPRGRTLEEDRARMEWLKSSEKNRAENLMIVDMVRNDMGRIAETGSVEVASLFDVERYPTVLQMTSTVKCRTSAPVTDILAALFPCASITGAPKIRTMEIIAELEKMPRGVYTGGIGFISPEKKAQFNVAIRTVLINREKQRAEYGVGGGIVWDSDSDDEYRECLIKARVLTVERPDFELLESILWEPQKGYFLLERHLKRLADSGEYFGFPVNLNMIRKQLSELDANLDNRPHKIRLRVNKNGGVRIESEPIDTGKEAMAGKVDLTAEPVDPSDPFLYHKTTNRAIYDAARASRPGYDDTLLWNTKGEITESTVANVVVKLNQEYFTPPVECGLLPGTYRAQLLEEGRIRERAITASDLKEAQEIYLINSVRKWMKVDLRLL